MHQNAALHKQSIILTFSVRNKLLSVTNSRLISRRSATISDR